MPTSVVMPALEMAQETGKLLAWRKREGDTVSKGEPLMEIETDKAVVEIEAEASGILAGIRTNEGDVVAVGQTIAWILAPGESVPTEDRQHATGRQASPLPSAAVPASAGEVTPDSGGRSLASPKARRLAAERGIDLSSVKGSGSGGAVLSADVTAGAPRAKPAGNVWRLMADRVTASWTTVPQFFVSREVDAGAIMALRARFISNDRSDGRAAVTYTDLLIKLVALALRGHPDANGSWVGGGVQHHPDIHIGIATAVEQGVVVPVVRHSDRLAVREIAAQRRELVNRARSGRLQPADLTGATFTISNLGMYKVDAFTAIVNPPQAAILAVGRIRETVVAQNGQGVVRSRMTLTLTSDHRVLDGARAAAFLEAVADAIEDRDERFHDAL